MDENERNKIIKENLKSGSWREDKNVKELKKKRRTWSNIIILGYIILFFTILLDFSMAGSLSSIANLKIKNNVIINLVLKIIGLIFVFLPNYPDLKTLNKKYEEADKNPDTELYKNKINQRLKGVKKVKKRLLIGVILIFFPFISKILIFPSSNEYILEINNILKSISGISGFIGIIFLMSGFLKLGFVIMSSGVDIPVEERVNEILNKIFDNIIFERNKGIEKEVVDDTNLIKYGNKFAANDYIEGIYRECKFKQSDIEYSNSSIEDNENYHIFNGRWLIVEYDKKIEGQIYIFDKNFKATKKSYINEKNLKKVEMEDQIFNNEFSIFATNPHEVFYILTPALMERIKSFADIDNRDKESEGIGVYCIDNKIHFAIDGIKDAFLLLELSLSEIEAEKYLANDISLITDTIDILVPNYKK